MTPERLPNRSEFGETSRVNEWIKISDKIHYQFSRAILRHDPNHLLYILRDTDEDGQRIATFALSMSTEGATRYGQPVIEISVPVLPEAQDIIQTELEPRNEEFVFRNRELKDNDQTFKVDFDNFDEVLYEVVSKKTKKEDRNTYLEFLYDGIPVPLRDPTDGIIFQS